MHEGAKCLRVSEIESMSPCLVCYNWLIVTTAQKKHCSLAVRNLPFFEHFVANIVLVDQEWLELGVALSCWKRKYSAATSDNCFDFYRNDDNFKELAKGFQLKNTKLSNSWALNIYSKWAKAHSEHMDDRALPKWACWLTTLMRGAKNCCLY